MLPAWTWPVVSSLLFATCNNVLKGLYNSGSTEVSVFVMRGFFIYFMNAALVAIRRRESTSDVLRLRCARASLRLAVLRGLCGAFMVLLLSLSFHYYLTVADSFSIFIGGVTIFTVALSRATLGATERLRPSAYLGGVATLVGLVIVSRPSR